MFGRSGRSATYGLRRYLWVAPVLGVIALIFAVTWARGRIESTIRLQKESELVTLLKADVKALEIWTQLQEDSASVMADDNEIRHAVMALADLAKAPNITAAQLLAAPQQKALSEALDGWIDAPGYLGYIVTDSAGLVIAAKPDVLVGQPRPISGQSFYEQVLNGRPTLSRPVPSLTEMPDEDGGKALGVPVMFVGARVLDDAQQPVGVVALRISPFKDFTKILNVASPGDTGETYAFDAQGLMLSNSRFDEDLKRIGLLPDKKSVHSVLTMELRDPGVDLMAGGRAELRRSEWPLTKMAAKTIEEKPSIDKPLFDAGYRDYRGVECIGAWAWLPQYQYGVAIEMDRKEAFAPLFIMRAIFWGLFGLLALGALLLFLLTLIARKLDRRMREAVVAIGQLGQYALEKKIGEGGMGSVYRAHHSMLRRPTAVKLLEPDKTTEVSIARFEREVQLTSLLNHPNTITIYDYGRTGEGVFYYAMELLDGYSLESLVEQFGPQPDGRVIQILLQVCGSLIEAHSQGLIHRDIKPANIMLTQRGGACDFVKLLDFGLVKAVDSKKTRALTAADAITGTPLYMPPESVQDSDAADARSDLYSLGAVGYFLLTGRPVFESGGVMEIMRSHVQDKPLPPSKRLARPMARELDLLILKCLEKSPKDRPQSAAEMAEVLSRCVPSQPWSMHDAQAWWQQHQPGVLSETMTSEVTRNLHGGGTIGATVDATKAKPTV